MSTADPSLDRLFRPKSAVFVGVSRNEASLGRRALRHMRMHGYQGEVLLVHPTADELDGVPAVPSLSELGTVPDLGVVCTHGDIAPEVVDELVELGVPGIVVFASSGKIFDDPKYVHDALEGTETRLLGPNCPGFVGVSPPVVPHISAFLRNTELVGGPVGLITQSGAIGGVIANRMLESGTGFDWLLCTGNEYDVSLGECLEFLADQPLKAVGLYVEGIRDADRFLEGLDACAERGIEVCAVKVGGSAAGQRQAMTHTGALTGSTALFEQALLERGGNLCHTLDELSACLSIATLPAAPRRSLVAAATSGGMAGVMGDLASEKGVDVPLLGEELDNPWDTDIIILTDQAAVARGLKDRLDRPEIGAGILAFSAHPDRILANLCKEIAEVGIDKPLVVVPAAGMPREAFDVLKGTAAVVMDTPSAIAALDWWTRGTPKVAAAERNGRPPHEIDVDESAAKAVLEGVGIAVPRGEVVASPEEAQAFAAGARGPFVLKCVKPAFAHKAAVGALRLGVEGDAASIEAAWRDMAADVEQATGEDVAEVLVEEQLRPGLELLVSLGHDADYGAYLTLGAGGSDVEADPDVAHRLLPADDAELTGALSSLRLGGALRQAARARGEDGPVPAELLAAARALASLAGQRPGINVEINPLILPFDAGAPSAVDCVVIEGGEAWPETV